MLNDNTDFNFIRVQHNGETVSLVQHKLGSGRSIQEVSILPELETIVSYDGTLESLIDTLQTIKNHMSENSQC